MPRGNPFKPQRVQFEDAEAVLDIRKGPNSGGWYDAVCPAHDDHNPSLGVKEADNGDLIVYCHAGCEFREVIDAIRDLID